MSETYTVSAHPYCHPKVNVFCHAGIGSVMGEAFYFVKKPAPFVRVAYAPGKTKAINPFCATAQKKKTVSSRLCESGGYRLCFYNEKWYNGSNHISERKTIAVFIVMTDTHDAAIVPHND